MAVTTPPTGGADTLAPTPQHSPTETQATQAPKQTIILGQPDSRAEDRSIRPFSYHASDEELAELKRRIAATRWPSRETVTDDTQGVQLATMRKVADYWLNQHDWRKVEARINSYSNFITSIDGVDIHFIHVKSRHPNAMPLIMTHGWPGSVFELLDVIEPLLYLAHEFDREGLPEKLRAHLPRVQDPELRTAIVDIFACQGRWYWRDRADD